MAASLDVTLRIQAKHAALWAAAKQLGGQSALAHHLGISPQEVGRWINLHKSPPIGTTCSYSKWNDAAFVSIVEERLFALTGKTLDELFPVELRDDTAFWHTPKTCEVGTSIDLDALSYDMRTRDRLTLPSPEIGACDNERKTCISNVLKTLSYREREIIKLRYGLDDGYSYTLKEVADIFKVTKERIRQIEHQAMRKLREPDRASRLESLLDNPNGADSEEPTTPLPEPNPAEPEDMFIQRCMADPMMNEEYPDSAQRYAVCKTHYEKGGER